MSTNITHLPVPPLPKGAPEGCYFDHASAAAACDFFPRYLRHTEAEWAGRPFHLRDWQRDEIVRPLFGWKRPDGARLYRQAYIEIPKKNGKTELAAGLGLLLEIGDGEFGAQVYALAVDKDQAKLVFSKAAVMVGFSEDLGKLIEPLTTSLFCQELMASFKPLSSLPAGKHGISVSGAVGDELHAWPNGELQDIVHKGTAGWRQPLEIYITTAGLYGVGFGWEMHDRAEKVRDGTITDPELLVVIYGADAEEDWTDPEVWARANPNLGISPKLDYMQRECAKAQESPRKENDFRRYHLNQWVEQVTRWIPIEKWDAAAGALDWRALEEKLEGRECFAGVDLSTKKDLTALVLVFPPEREGEPWHALYRFFVPKNNMKDRIKTDRVPYDEWERAGALFATPGNVIDYGFLEEQLEADARKFRIVECAFDPFSATQFSVRMQGEGITMVEFRQGWRTISEPSKWFEALVLDGMIRHGGHPVARWCVKNVAIETDAKENIAPSKKHSNERIDGVVATIMAVGRATVHANDNKPIRLPENYEVAVA